MKASIFTIDFFIAVSILVVVIITILNLDYSPVVYPQRKVMDIAISLDDKGVFWEDEQIINKSLNGGSAIVKCYKYTGNWEMVSEKRVINSKPKFWYRIVRVHEGDFCTIDVGI